MKILIKYCVKIMSLEFFTEYLRHLLLVYKNNNNADWVIELYITTDIQIYNFLVCNDKLIYKEYIYEKIKDYQTMSSFLEKKHKFFDFSVMSKLYIKQKLSEIIVKTI